MNRPDKELLEKYFDGSASKAEAKKILEWFQTDEGVQYVEKHFQLDRPLELDPHKDQVFSTERKSGVFDSIQDGINNKRISTFYLSKPVAKRRNSYKLVAASILVLFTMLYLIKFTGLDNNSTEVVTHQTGPLENKSVVLSDGTKIRLSENTKLTLATEESENGNVLASLDGQAYFEVANQGNREFQITSMGTVISVLGTSFNVNTLNQPKNVIVAVSSGRVLFKADHDENGILLTENMVGFYDRASGKINRESSEVHNYLSWIHGSIIFTNVSFREVLRQLESIYGIRNEIKSEELNGLKLTANFKAGSIEDVLNTIAEGLDIHYSIENGTILWDENISKN